MRLCLKSLKISPRSPTRTYGHRSEPLPFLPSGNPDRRRRTGADIKKPISMGFFMRKIQMLLSPFISQPAVFAGVYLPALRSGCEARSHRGNPQNLPAPNSTFSHLSIYHYRSAILATPAPLYNPHSRNVGAAPRFSPTRFIPPLRLPEYFGA